MYFTTIISEISLRRNGFGETSSEKWISVECPDSGYRYLAITLRSKVDYEEVQKLIVNR